MGSAPCPEVFGTRDKALGMSNGRKRKMGARENLGGVGGINRIAHVAA